MFLPVSHHLRTWPRCCATCLRVLFKAFFKALSPAFHDRSVRSAIKKTSWRKQRIFLSVFEFQDDVIEGDMVRFLPEIADAGINDVAERNRSFFCPEPVRVFDNDAAQPGIDDYGLFPPHQESRNADEEQEHSQQKPARLFVRPGPSKWRKPMARIFRLQSKPAKVPSACLDCFQIASGSWAQMGTKVRGCQPRKKLTD